MIIPSHRATGQQWYDHMFIFSVLIWMVLLFIYLVTHFAYAVVVVPFLAVCFISISVMNPKYTFAFVTSSILVMGLIMFAYVQLRYYYYHDSQTDFIASHFLISVMLFLFWLLDRHYRKVFLEKEALETKFIELQGYPPHEQLLSYPQFLTHMQFIAHSLNRSGKESYLVTAKSEYPALEHLLIDAATQTFRNNYDLITQKTALELIIFLQDTTLQGAETAINRLKEAINKRTSANYEFTIEKVEPVELKRLVE